MATLERSLFMKKKKKRFYFKMRGIFKKTCKILLLERMDIQLKRGIYTHCMKTCTAFFPSFFNITSLNYTILGQLGLPELFESLYTVSLLCCKTFWESLVLDYGFVSFWNSVHNIWVNWSNTFGCILRQCLKHHFSWCEIIEKLDKISGR